MPPPTIQWYGAEITRELGKAVNKGLKKAADYTRTLVVRKISRSARVGKGGSRYPSAKARRPMQFKRSKPGQPPRSDTGGLKKSIFSDTDLSRGMASVGTKVKYGAYLELGADIPDRYPTRKQAMVFGGETKTEAVYDKRFKNKKARKRKGMEGSANWGWVFAKKVKGFKLEKRPFLWSTVEQNKERLRGIVLLPAKDFVRRGDVRFGAPKARR